MNYNELSKEELIRELLGTQQMLGQVLLAVGEPVFVTKESLERQLPKNARISIDDNLEAEAFVFYVEVPENE
jgi:hypothetical protein